MRYVKNNFFDGARQDAFDLCLGTFQISATSTFSPFGEEGGSKKPPIVYLVPFCAALSFGLLISTLLVGFESRGKQLLLLLCCSAVILACGWVLLTYNEVFVDLPRLVQKPASAVRARAASRRRQLAAPSADVAAWLAWAGAGEGEGKGKDEGDKDHGHPRRGAGGGLARLARPLALAAKKAVALLATPTPAALPLPPP